MLVRYEKFERSFVAPNHIAAVIIAFRKVPLKINMIYRWVLPYLPSSIPSSAARVWAAISAFSNSAFMSEACIEVMAA